MGTKDKIIFHRGVAMRLEVFNQAFVGNDAGFLDPIHFLPDLDLDVSVRVSNVEQGLFNNPPMGNVLEMDPHILEVGHRVVQAVVDDFCCDVAGPFVGVEDDGADMDIGVQQADGR